MQRAEHFARIDARVNRARLSGALVVVAGVGAVGSHVAWGLANDSVGHLRLIDGQVLEPANLFRHALGHTGQKYVDTNKAEAMTLHLDDNVPGIRAEAVARAIDAAMSDAQLDRCLEDADLIIAATDDREAQQRIGRRAFALSVPAIFPALYRDGGGEVIVQLDSRLPCFFCWDGYRQNAEQLRGVSSLSTEPWPIIDLAIRLSLGVLDPHSEYRNLMAEPHGRPNQAFVQERDAPLDRAPLEYRDGCPSCAVGPAASLSEPRRASLPSTQAESPTIPMPALFVTLAVAIVAFIAFIAGVVEGNTHPSDTTSAGVFLGPMALVGLVVCMPASALIVRNLPSPQTRSVGMWCLGLIVLTAIAFAFGFGLTHGFRPHTTT